MSNIIRGETSEKSPAITRAAERIQRPWYKREKGGLLRAKRAEIFWGPEINFGNLLLV